MQAKRSNRPVRIVFGLIATVLVIYAALWSAAYLLADRMAEKYFFQREKQFGREWSCKQRQSGGFLVSLSYRCSGALLQTVSNSQPVQVTVQTILASASVLRPLSIRIDVSGPLQIANTTKSSLLEATWESLIVEASGSFSRSGTLAVIGKNIDVRTLADEGQHHIAVQTLAASVEIKPSSGSGSQDAMFDLAATGIAASPLDRAFGNSKTGELASRFSIKHAERLFRGRLPDRMDAWRESGGAIDVASFRFSRERLALEATGTIGLDALRRPNGQIAGRAAGLTELLRIFGVSDGNSRPGGLLGGLFRRQTGDVAANSETPGRMIPFSFSMKEGALWLGPIRTPVQLRPLI